MSKAKFNVRWFWSPDGELFVSADDLSAILKEISDISDVQALKQVVGKLEYLKFVTEPHTPNNIQNN